MRGFRGIVAAMSVTSLAIGCGGGSGGASGEVDYKPANGIDGTAPTVNLLETRPGDANLEVQGQNGPSAKKSTNFGNPAPNSKKDFSILATAKDDESGIRNLKIVMTRNVCFKTAAGDIAAAPFATVVRKEANWTDQSHAPTNPSLGETGIIDNSAFATDPANRNETNLLVFRNAQGNLLAGTGVSTKWGMEATNFAGKTTYSDVIFVLAGDLTCPMP